MLESNDLLDSINTTLLLFKKVAWSYWSEHAVVGFSTIAFAAWSCLQNLL
ncbi:hypothetical protein [Helicobacter jaachi]|nr:hypothetical protein [Helicobacter jaachi]